MLAILDQGFADGAFYLHVRITNSYYMYAGMDTPKTACHRNKRMFSFGAAQHTVYVSCNRTSNLLGVMTALSKHIDLGSETNRVYWNTRTIKRHFGVAHTMPHASEWRVAVSVSMLDNCGEVYLHRTQRRTVGFFAQ